MHEWALAESIITATLEAADKEKLGKIIEIKISVGELQSIERDIFEFALHEIIKDRSRKLKDAKIIIETEKSTFRCKNCENTWNFNDIKIKYNKNESEAIHFIPEVAFVYTRCRKCGSRDFEIISGRGVSIKSIKGEK